MSFFGKRHIFVLGKRRCFGNRYSFGNCPKTVKMGHMAGPSTGNGANHLGLPSDGAIRPSDLGPSDSLVGAIHRAFPGEWTRGAR